MGPTQQSPWVPAVTAQVWPMRVPGIDHSRGPLDFVIWKICQKDENISDINLNEVDNSSR